MESFPRQEEKSLNFDGWSLSSFNKNGIKKSDGQNCFVIHGGADSTWAADFSLLGGFSSDVDISDEEVD